MAQIDHTGLILHAFRLAGLCLSLKWHHLLSMSCNGAKPLPGLHDAAQEPQAHTLGQG